MSKTSPPTNGGYSVIEDTVKLFHIPLEVVPVMPIGNWTLVDDMVHEEQASLFDPGHITRRNSEL